MSNRRTVLLLGILGLVVCGSTLADEPTVRVPLIPIPDPWTWRARRKSRWRRLVLSRFSLPRLPRPIPNRRTQPQWLSEPNNPRKPARNVPARPCARGVAK